jgi:metal-sulfur cluster biosynthetic enzyme
MNVIDPAALRQLILDRLRLVIDPETSTDVVRMRLVENLSVDQAGCVSYTFHPSSPLCPIAVYLVQQIKAAVAQVPGVLRQEITVVGYIAAEQLTELINKETKA